MEEIVEGLCVEVWALEDYAGVYHCCSCVRFIVGCVQPV